MVDWGSPRWLNLCSTWGSCRFSACAFLLPGFQGGTATNASLPPDTNPLGFQTFSQDIMIGLVTISLFLLAAATYCFVRKGACRERCQRQQQVPSHEAEGTDDNEIHYSTIAHVGRNKVSCGTALVPNQGAGPGHGMWVSGSVPVTWAGESHRAISTKN
ncbi:uncharacterized protein LOC127462126 isoform X2 [Manacus candei]|uniref:uncharacterized protein LOC127462126 isoform X2 n=1 Tax=Manacus candei TaxID=415023 RepID=UPI0022261636|nr:uncharacterized protein LOC127462126 isoform X2 [Manacus candei]